jgi:hypothetical protein
MTSDAEGVLKALSARFAPNMVLLRGGFPIDRDGTPCMKPLFYLNRTLVIDRLDEVLTPLDWMDEYFQAGSATVCKLSIRIGDTWYSKSDCAGESEIEGIKGAATDALKRAASKWGVGSYLYKVDNDEYLPGFRKGDRGPFFTRESKEFAYRRLWDDFYLAQNPGARVLLSLCKACNTEEEMAAVMNGNSDMIKDIAGNENIFAVFKRTLQGYKDAIKEGE